MSLQSSIRFNALKHHLSWVKNFIESLHNDSGNLLRLNLFIEEVKAINSNQVDIYTGPFSAEQIIAQVEDQLIAHQINNKQSFSAWLGLHEYRQITLTDSSMWILRLGVEEDLYIHIHPARNSPNAVRVHGNSWKTAIIAKVFYADNMIPELALINKLRKEYLDLSPVKDLKSSQRIAKVRMLLG